LAAGGLNGRIELWDTATWSKQRTLIGHFSWITDMAFSPDTNASLLATTSRDGTVRLWSTARGEREEFLPFDATPHAWDPNWQTALYLDPEERTYTLQDIATQSNQAVHPFPYFASNVVRGSIGLGPGGRVVAVALWDRTIVLWDPVGNAGKGEARWTLPTKAAIDRTRFASDGRLLVGWGGGRIWIWDVRAGREIACATNSWNNYWYHLPQFTADQGQLAIPFGSEGEICLWDFAGSGEIIRFEGLHPDCMSLALSPDGCTLVTGNRDGTLKLWDVASRKEIREIGGRGLRLIGVTFSPDGRRVFASSIDEITVWDVRTGSKICNLRRDSQPGGLLVFQDPDTLIAGFRPGTRRLHAPSFAEIEAAEAKRRIAEGSSQ